MNKNHEHYQGALVSRRRFLRATTAAGVAVAACGVTGLHDIAVADGKSTDSEEGTWIPASCTCVCGSGRCVNKVLVKDGTIIRQKTDEMFEDTEWAPQLRGCIRGRSQRKSVLGVDRLRYPMKRKNWQPGGGESSHGELRGVDEWERITWDEALDLTASELNRIREQYGNDAICGGWAFGPARLLGAIGGAVRAWGSVSLGAWAGVLDPMTGTPYMTMYNGAGSINDRLNFRKAKLIVIWGANPAWSAAANAIHVLKAKQAGAKIIVVDPMCSDSAIAYADQWISIRPSTDTAMLLAVAYHMIENNLQDQDFLDSYCVGFDSDHMPEGHEGEENFKDYVLGTYDNTPKTPDWASEICGVDAAVIKALAEEIATTKPMSFVSGYAPARTYGGEQYCQAFLTVGWMTGNVGKAGACVGVSSNTNAFNGGPMLIQQGADGLPAFPNAVQPYAYAVKTAPPAEDTNWHGPVADEMWESVVSGKYTAGTRGEQPIKIKAITHFNTGNPLNQMPNLNKGIEAHRAVDFVVAVDYFPSTSVRYADIILPLSHPWEQWGSFAGINVLNRENFSWGSRVIEPLYETHDDLWIETEVARRMGVDAQSFAPFSSEQCVFNTVVGTKVVKEDGVTYENLAQVTEDDLEEFAKLGITGTPQDGRVPILELKQQGVYRVERSENDNFGYIAYKDFVDDPEANPLNTESGKFEICCPALSLKTTAYGWTELPAIPKYQVPKRGYEESKEGDYPLQLITPHYMRRAHSIYDNNPWLREAFPQELFINADDAAARGIEDGDVVECFNEFGRVLRHATVTQRLHPGVVAMGEGAWARIDEETGLDVAGATNSLQGCFPSGQGTQCWNTNVVQVEKSNRSLDEDYLVEPRVIEETKE